MYSTSKITLVRKVLLDTQGASMIEFTLVFPVLLLVAFGTVDVTMMLFDWARANKAAYRGARVAVVAPPVAGGITNLTYNSDFIGDDCFDQADGQPVGICETVSTTCTPQSSGGQCVGTHTTFQDAAFTTILTEMQQILPRLQRENVQISYRSTSLGFAGRPDGVPMELTVSVRCMTSQFFFLSALMNWVFPSLPDDCPAAPPGPAMPAFATTLTSESMGS